MVSRVEGARIGNQNRALHTKGKLSAGDFGGQGPVTSFGGGGEFRSDRTPMTAYQNTHLRENMPIVSVDPEPLKTFPFDSRGRGTTSRTSGEMIIIGRSHGDDVGQCTPHVPAVHICHSRLWGNHEGAREGAQPTMKTRATNWRGVNFQGKSGSRSSRGVVVGFLFLPLRKN